MPLAIAAAGSRLLWLRARLCKPEVTGSIPYAPLPRAVFFDLDDDEALGPSDDAGFFRFVARRDDPKHGIGVIRFVLLCPGDLHDRCAARSTALAATAAQRVNPELRLRHVATVAGSLTGSAIDSPVFRPAKSWEARVKRYFAFLDGYGFRLDHVGHEQWATSAVYVSKTLGVEVTRSSEFQRVEIQLLRLYEGRLPEPQVWVTDAPIDNVLLDNVLEARAPDQFPRLKGGLSRREVDEQLRVYAELLRSVVPDFLEGSDAALLDGERIIRQRVAANPQELTIWLPSDAAESDEAKARADVERTTPPEVRVVVKRYRQ